MSKSISLDFPACLSREFPKAFRHAWSATEDILDTIPGSDYSVLAKRSPALKKYDWLNYIRCSAARMVQILDAIQRQPQVKTVLDVGAYFGNFTLMCQRAGYQTSAVDSYREYDGCFSKSLNLLQKSGVRIYDFADTGPDLSALPKFDAIVCAGVIEHIPHTPRLLLETLTRRLNPKGVLILETPNLAYLYNRQRFLRGESVFCPIEYQFHTELPFEGHHREYTIGEVRWMLEQVGHKVIELKTFNYSIYGAKILTGQDAENYEAMALDSTAREIILCISSSIDAAKDLTK